ncbi:MAG TPA: hypothetical protein VFZ34_05650, partial [Blastocatellia bacterium]|nr:hypothetical protein [Blastocatellia bacterium]
MQKSKLTIAILILAVLLVPAGLWARAAQQQTAPRKYVIRPMNLGTNTEIRARSTRNLQVQVTDENDRPISDAPLLFLLSGLGSGSGATGTLAAQTAGSAAATTAGQTASTVAGTLTGPTASSVAGTLTGQAASSVTGTVAGQAASSVAGTTAGQAAGNSAGNLAAQTSLRAMTNQYGIANVNFTAPDSIGSAMRLQVRVEGTDAVWEGTLEIARAEAITEPAQNTAAPVNAASLPAMDAEEQACIALINQFRAENLQAPVKVSAKLTNAAQWLSRDNAEHKADDPDHTDSLGRDVSKRLLDYGYAADIIKENIVLGV